jgi:competence protein ComEA
MKECIREKLHKDQTDDERKQFIAKIFLVIAVILFFVGIAFFQVMRQALAESRNSIVVQTISASISVQSYRGTEHPDSGSTGPLVSAEGIPVYLVGAVKDPGIYTIDGPIYLYQLVERAGGFTGDADSRVVNLAFRITENIMIRIPTMDESSKGDSGGYSSALLVSTWQSFDSQSTGQNAEPVKVNINTADETALCTLPGIGESTAKAIMDYRTRNGPFQSIEGIMKVSGIKESRFRQIRDYITIGK